MLERRAFLQSSLDMTNRMASAFLDDEDETALDPAQRLVELQARYQNLRAKYSTSHPDVIRVKREIGEIRDQLGDTATSDGQSIAAVDPTIVRMKADLDAATADVASLEVQKARLIEKAKALEEKIAKSPRVESEYQALVRDRENLIRDHNEAQDKISEARLAEPLEAEQKGERFTMLENPSTPNRPLDPDPRKLFGLGLILSFLGGFGAVVGVEKIDERVRNPEQVEMSTGASILSVVPYIRTHEERRRNVRIILIGIIVIILSFIPAAYLVHHYHKPLHEIEKLQWIRSIWMDLNEQIRGI